MKFNKSMIFMAALAVGTLFTSCSEGEYWDEYSENGTKYSFQSASNDYSYTATEEIPALNVTIIRTNANAAETLPVTLTDEKGVFTAQASEVTFNAGESTANYVLTVGELVAGVTYTATVAFGGDYTSISGDSITKISVTRELEWETTSTRGYYLDGTVSTFFGVDPSIPMAIDIYKAVGADQYRFESPFAHVSTGNDGFGYFGYPYNAAGDCDEKCHWQRIIVASDGVTLVPTEVGMNWGYGMFTIGTIYGYMSTNLAKYPLGVYHQDKGYVEFPANSLYVTMADYGTGVAANPSYVFMNQDAFVKFATGQ